MAGRGLDEHGLRRKVVGKLNKLPGVVAKKYHPGGYGSSGFPDLMVFFYRGDELEGGTLLCELKRPDGSGKLTPLQTRTHSLLELVGHDVLVASSLEEILDEMRERGYAG
tara:strand:+ start:6443 stop:6772 length:330 start_codon:yes stop_codon:yes gene_type:complete